MEKIKLTPEQLAQYKAIVDSIEKLRSLTEAEKEKLVKDIMEKPFLNLLCDVALKYVFQNDMNCLMMLLNDFLPEKIVSVRPMPNELVSPVIEDKKPVLDVIATINDKREVIIEMQQERRKAFFPRLYYYGSTLLSRQLKKGMHYKDLMPVYVICFTDFTIRHKGCPKTQLIYEYQHREKIGGATFTNLHTTYICELPRLAKKALSEMDPVESWFYILKNSGKFAEKPEGLDPRYDQVFEAAKTNRVPGEERLQYLRAMLSDYDKKDISEAYYEAGHEDGYEQGMVEGVEKGKAEGKAETARAMLADGMSPELVSKYTGLSEEEISQLKEAGQYGQ